MTSIKLGLISNAHDQKSANQSEYWELDQTPAKFHVAMVLYIKNRIGIY